MPVSKERLLALTGTASAYSRGTDYWRGKHVTYVKKAQDEYLATVRGGGGRRYEVDVGFTPDGNDLLAFRCDCPAFEQYQGICKHIVATVLTVQGYEEPTIKVSLFPAAPPPRSKRRAHGSTGHEASGLVERYAQRMADRASALQEGSTVLEATLELGSRGVSLSCKVGQSRLYVVHDLGKFANNIKKGRMDTYGTKYTLWHNIASFTAGSRPLVYFLTKYYDPESSPYPGGRNGYGYNSNTRLMHLAPHMLDELIRLYDGRALPIGGVEAVSSAVIRRADYRPTLRLRQSGSGYTLSAPEPLHVLRGTEAIYVLAGDSLYCCGAGYSRACGDLLETLAKNSRQLYYMEKDMKALFSTVLLEAGPYIHLDAEADVGQFKPAPLVTGVYLDMLPGDDITAKMTFSYNGESHAAFYPKSIADTQDIAGEFYAEAMLLRYFTGPADDQGQVHIKGDSDAAYRLLSEGLGEISRFARIYATDGFGKLQIRPPSPVRMGVRIESGLLHLDFDLEGLDLAELAGILDSYRRAKKYHRLKDGSFLVLEDDGFSQLSQLAEGLDLNKKELASGHAELARSRALFLDAMIKQGESIRCDRDEEFKRIVIEMEESIHGDFTVPGSLENVLRNYQKAGYRWLRTVDRCGFGGILADDMGLGKTLQVLALLQAEKDEADEGALSIVICPASLILNWESEARRFTPGLRVSVITGSAPERAGILALRRDFDLLVTSYDLLKRDIELYEPIDFSYVIVDEAQYIKNHSTQNAKAVKLLRGRTRFALTGTPVENSLAELWSIFDFLMPGYLFSYSRFRKKYELPIVRQNSRPEAGRLRQMVRPFMLRRLKKDVLRELPDKTETVLRVAMEDEQRSVYLGTLVQAKKELAPLLGSRAGNGQLHMNVLAALTRLRQICCDPSLIYDNYPGGSVKLEACLELVESCTASGHRMLLFSQFTSMLNIIENRLEGMGIRSCKLEGSTKPSRRLELVTAFNTGDIPVFLISLKAGGTGLNLTGADVVIHYDPWWNMSVQNQATDRAHRIGQKNTVQIYKLIVKDTIEERILKMQENKAELAGQFVLEGGNVLAGMRREDLLSLLEEK